MLTPATSAIRNKNVKRQKIGREQVAFLSIVANVVEVVDLQEEALIMNNDTAGCFVDGKKPKMEEIKPQWEPSNFKALFCHGNRTFLCQISRRIA